MTARREETPSDDGAPSDQLCPDPADDSVRDESPDQVLCECASAGRPPFHFVGATSDFHDKKRRSQLVKMITDGVVYAIDSLPSSEDVKVHVDVRRVESYWRKEIA